MRTQWKVIEYTVNHLFIGHRNICFLIGANAGAAQPDPFNGTGYIVHFYLVAHGERPVKKDNKRRDQVLEAFAGSQRNGCWGDAKPGE